MRILYISYDGMLEPLGESQVVSFLIPVAQKERVTLLSYEKGRDLRDRARLKAMEDRLRSHGITWIRMRYHQRPLLVAKVWDILRGYLKAFSLCARWKIQIVHARGYVASLLALFLKRLCGVRFLFDMRGFWADEKVEGGHWKRESWMYRLSKRWERQFFEEADGIVSLTQEGVRQFPALGFSIPLDIPIEIIPTCADLERFSPGARDPLVGEKCGLTGRPIFGCVGNLSGWYLRRPMLEYLAILLASFPGAQALFVTQEDPLALRRDAQAVGIPSDRSVVTSAHFEEMPSYLRWMDAGIFFIQPSFSKRGSAATKCAEFLGAGVPVVINDGVGDSGAIVREEKVGVVVPRVNQRGFEESIPQVMEILQDPECSARCRLAAQRHFDLKMGVEKYLALYRRLGTVQRHEGWMYAHEEMTPG